MRIKGGKLKIFLFNIGNSGVVNLNKIFIWFMIYVGLKVESNVEKLYNLY